MVIASVGNPSRTLWIATIRAHLYQYNAYNETRSLQAQKSRQSNDINVISSRDFSSSVARMLTPWTMDGLPT